MEYENVSDAWDDPKRRYPTIVYVETVNLCNALCLCCPTKRLKRPRGIMPLEDFKVIADKVKARGLKVGAMFCFGEPFLDPTLIDKMEYGRMIDVFPSGHYGFNTNGSLIKPDHYEGIMRNTTNITFSCYNVGTEYDRLTGNLSWDKFFETVTNFIKYRDCHYPAFNIFIGTNKIPGSDLAKVKEAFRGYNVQYAVDANINYGEHNILTGIVDRSILYDWWTCDGHVGAVQVKFNGDCEYCAFDQIGTPTGGFTKVGNLLTGSFDDVERNFKAKWKTGSEQCKRCDYWNRYKAVKACGFRRPAPLPNDWYDWQKPYLDGGAVIP